MDTPPDPKELLARAHVYLRRGEHDRAVEALTQAIDADLHFVRANAHAAAGAFAAAADDFTAAINLRPDFAAAYHNRGMALADQGRDDEAVADFSEAIRLSADDPDPLNGRGVVHARLRWAAPVCEFPQQRRDLYHGARSFRPATVANEGVGVCRSSGIRLVADAVWTLLVCYGR